MKISQNSPKEADPLIVYTVYPSTPAKIIIGVHFGCFSLSEFHTLFVLLEKSNQYAQESANEHILTFDILTILEIVKRHFKESLQFKF